MCVKVVMAYWLGFNRITPFYLTHLCLDNMWGTPKDLEELSPTSPMLTHQACLDIVYPKDLQEFSPTSLQVNSYCV